MTKFAQFLIVAMILVLAMAVISLYYLQKSNEQSSVQDALILESGIALFQQDRHQEAFETLRGIPIDSPYEWQAKYYQGSALIMLENFESAVVYLEQAYALNDHETQIMHALGVAQFKLGNMKSAKEHFAAILEIDPADEEARDLMDVMAKLEREQSDNIFPDTTADSIELTTGKDAEGR